MTRTTVMAGGCFGKHALRFAALASVLILASCGDREGRSPVEPSGGDPPVSFEVVIPPAIIRDQAFSLTVSALDEAGQRDSSWRGTATLSASNGTLSPTTVQLENGTATVPVTLSGHAGEVTIRATNGNAQSDPVTAMVLSGAAPVRIEVEPSAALLTAAGATQAFEARAYDAQGNLTEAQIEWRSNDAATVAIAANGVATAAASSGSAQIIAAAAGIESPPALVLVARPAGTPVLLADSQIVSDPVPVDADAAFEPGWQYRVRVRNAAPQPGDIVIGTGERPLAGRVVAVVEQGAETELTVELVALDQLFTDLRIDEAIPLVESAGDGGLPGGGGPSFEQPPGYLLAAADTFTVAGFTCTASGKLPPLSLPSPTWTVTPTLALELVYNGGLERLVVTGEIEARFAYRPVLSATFEGKLGCEKIARTVTIPVGGLVSVFFGIQVPVGIGLELDGTITIAEVGFDISAEASASAELGMTCQPGGGPCSGVTEFDARRDGSFKLISPDPSEQFRISLGAHGYLFAKPALGTALSKKAQFEIIAATAGLKQTINLAPARAQVSDTAYASSFELASVLKVGAGADLTKAITGLGKRLGTDLDLKLSLVDTTANLAASPRGTFTITPPRVLPGDSTALGELATFTIELDTVNYFGSYAVDEVEIFWKQEDDNGGFTLEPARPACAAIATSAGQKKFECQTDFLEEHLGEQTFYAFVHPKLFGVPLPLPLEIATDAKALVDVGDCTLDHPLSLSSQAAVDAAAGRCDVTFLAIYDPTGSADPIVDLTPLASLRRVRSGIQIGPTRQLSSLAGLEQLALDSGYINISANAALTSLAGLAQSAATGAGRLQHLLVSFNPVLVDMAGLANLLSPGGTDVIDYVSITSNPSLASVDGLERIRSARSVGIGNNAALQSVSGLSGLQSVSGSIGISQNGLLTAVSISGVATRGVSIFSNPTVETVVVSLAAGFDSTSVDVRGSDMLTSLDVHGDGAAVGDLNFVVLPELTSLNVTGFSSLGMFRLSGAAKLESMSVASMVATNRLEITGTALTGFSGVMVADTIADRFVIRDNTRLSSIDAFQNLRYIAGQLVLTYNPMLCVPEWLDDVGGGGLRTITGNRSEGC